MRIDLSHATVAPERIEEKRALAENAMDRLWSGEEPFTGWVRLPFDDTERMMEDLLNTAADVWTKCDLFVVVGVGGSYMGANAVLEALGPRIPGFPRVLFAGYNLDGEMLLDISRQVQKEETCLCVISKSGATLETLVAFSVLKEIMIQKYGKAANGRIYAVTDDAQGLLREESTANGYTTFPIPDDIGGRFSVLTPVGLFPLAVAGVDIRALMKGAKDMAEDPKWDVDATDYAIARVCLGESGKYIEAHESFDPSIEQFGQWLKQLFGESEGKEGKGIYPTVLSFTRDLHSVGQYLQEGTPVFFETMLLFESAREDLTIPDSAGPRLSGLTISQINGCIQKGVIAAHTKAQIPVITVTMPQKDAYNLGGLIYFFEMTCGISALMIGVNPFNQPGVERYKQESNEEIRKLRPEK